MKTDTTMGEAAGAPAEPGGPEKAAASWRDRFGGANLYGLFFLTVIYAFNYFDRQLLGLLLPQIKADMALTDTELALVSGAAFVICYSIVGVPVARLADRIGRKKVIAAGFCFWSLATAAMGMVVNVWQLAAARLLTGAGEAAGISPSNAMVADMTDAKRRPFTLGILSSGGAWGAIILFPIAGWMATEFGWRFTFIVSGLAGLVLAAVFYLTVGEPAKEKESEKPQNFLEALRYLAGAKTYLILAVGSSFMAINVYATQIWSPTFLERIHGLTIAEIGASLGPVRGVASLAGAIAGGWLTARLSARDMRWMVWVPGMACVAVLPVDLLFIYAPTIGLSLVGYAFTGFFMSMHLGPLYAVCLSVAGKRMKATAVAVFLLTVNLVGQILGPLIVGMISDIQRAVLGDESIRLGLMVAAWSAAAGGTAMIIASRWLINDLKRSETIE